MVPLPNLLIIPAGLAIGVLVAAPVGPVNVLCIQRAIERGFWGGVAAGLGSVMGDGVIAFCAAMGVGQLSGAVEYHRPAIQVVGGIALIVFALKLFFTPPKLLVSPILGAAAPRLRDFAWDIPQTFFLTITNPGAVLGLIAIFGGVSTFLEIESTIEALAMVASIMAGSLCWWIGLSHLIGRIRHRIDAGVLRKINRGAAILLAGFGGLLLGEVILKAGQF